MAFPPKIQESRTYAGSRVIIYTTDAGGEYSIHGAYEADHGWVQCAWRANGRFNADDKVRTSLDIII